MRFLAILFTCLLMSPQAFAETSCPGETTREIEECLALNRDEANSELERFRVEVIRILSNRPAVEAAFVASQTAWLKYRQAECQAVYEYWKEGSIRNIQLLGCEEQLARQRTWQLWSTYLRGMVTDLPEPSWENLQ